MNLTTVTLPVPDRPLPEPTVDSMPYWAGLNEGRLLIQRCAHCGKFRHYPTPTCPDCFSFDVDWVDSTCNARVHSWTVAHHAFHPAFKGELPYVIVTADLDEGVRIVARVRDVTAGELRMGLPLRVSFEQIGQGVSVPVLVPALVPVPVQGRID